MKQLSLVCVFATLLLSPYASAQTTQASFKQCLNTLKTEAIQSGISSRTFHELTDHIVPDENLLEKLNYQPEFKTPIWDYMAALVDDERIKFGKNMLAEHRYTLDKISKQYGVDPATIVAIWGIESNFGQNQGKYFLIESLSTLSCIGHRQAFFRKQLLAAMRIIQSGDISSDRLVGSWAGAFGHTQFMPTTFERIAIDFDKDGRRDLMDDIPDALASTANYLKKNGWITGQPWGVEVKLPHGFNPTGHSRTQKKTILYWAHKGLTGINGDAIATLAGSDKLKAGLFMPAGLNGPVFLVFKNFDVIYSYNAAESYALAIAHLSDRLKNDKPFVTPWPTDNLGLSRIERRTLQTLLLQRGYDIGDIDGIIGKNTRKAIKAEQTRLGMKADGRASHNILNALQE